MTEHVPVRTKRGKVIHATAASDYRFTTCGRPLDPARLADNVPNCARCLRILAGDGQHENAP